MLYDDYVSITADGNSVFTFLCTRNLGPEEVSLLELQSKCTETNGY